MAVRSPMVSPALFPAPFSFTPDRWLGENDKKLDKYLMPFSRGTRGCLGQKYASPPSLSLHPLSSFHSPLPSFLPSTTPPHTRTEQTHSRQPMTILTPVPKSSLALAEITLAIAILFRRFEFELHDTDARAVGVTRDRFAAGLDRESRGTRVRVLREFSE